MKNRIIELFRKKKKDVLSIFFTAGYPSLNSTLRIVELLEKHGADMIEIGMPFSDPLADGPVIQKSSEQALKNGMSLHLLFEQIKDMRKQVNIPVVLMGYLNPFLQFGMKEFVEHCKLTGVDGVILPDLSPEYYVKNYKSLFEENNLSMIFLVTPATTSERIKEIDILSNAFIYLVSSASTTGNKAIFDEENYKRINSLSLNNPLLFGFGISDKESFNKAGNYANGAIIGSAFVTALAHRELEDVIPVFLKSIIN